ncbi:MAG: GTPase [Phycisphaerales bacterium]
MNLHDTIIAWASAPGQSHRAVLRLSGSWADISRVLHGAAFPGVSRATLRAGGLSLPVLAITWRGPRSYTGQDGADVLIPGNPHLADALLRGVTTGGVIRQASPGEFSARACLAGKLTIEQAEGVAAVIAADGEAELSAARDLSRGVTGARYRAWAGEITRLLALVEAGIDFTDQEDVRAIAPSDLARSCAAMAGEMLGMLGTPDVGSTLPRVVLAGEPNAGKSTLFNALLGRRRAITSPVAGTTRDVLEEPLDLSSDKAGAVVLADMPGLEDGADALGEAEREAQAAAGDAIRTADLVLWCDPSGRFESAVPAGARAVIRVRTCADRGAPGREDLAVCAIDGWHVPALRRAIADATWGSSRGASCAGLLPRHRAAIAAAARVLADVEASPDGEPALVAERLRDAATSIGDLTGRINPDDVLARVFSTFCIGK